MFEEKSGAAETWLSVLIVLFLLISVIDAGLDIAAYLL
jgi:hypothetical protein